MLRFAKNLMAAEGGATMVEYALMLFVILVVAASAVKALGSKVNVAVGSSIAVF